MRNPITRSPSGGTSTTASDATYSLRKDILQLPVKVCKYPCRFYNEALQAACGEGLLGLFLMLVSAVISAITFTILVWCHLNPWSRFKFRRDEVRDIDEKC